MKPLSQKQEDEPPSPGAKNVCIGIALAGEGIQVTARAGGHEIGCGTFPAGSIGTAALLCYLANWRVPLRLAVATAGAAALNIALVIGAYPAREVFLVSAQIAAAASDLARYAERAI
jgi:hypothetical protein